MNRRKLSRHSGRTVCRLLLAAFLGSTAYAGSFSLRATGGYFMPRDQDFKDIYGNGFAYGTELDVGVWKGICVWAGIGYFSGKGELTLSQDITKLSIYPFFGGLKYRFLKPPVSPYIALGIGYYRYKETNPLDTVDGSETGFIGQAGVSLDILRSLSLEAYARYTDCRIQPADLEANLGGLEVGAGLGFRF